MEIVENNKKQNRIFDFFKNNKRSVINVALAVLLFAILIITSGYAPTSLLSDTFADTIVLIVCFFIVGFIYVATNDFSASLNSVKKKKPTWCFIIIVTLGIGAILTMFLNGETMNLISYTAYGLRILTCYLIAKLLNFKKFISIFQHGMFAISIIALVVFSLSIISGTSFSFFGIFKSFKGEEFQNYFFLCFQGNHTRLQGPFWEPGLFCSFLLVALAFEILFYKKIRWLYFVTFLICLFFTASTFGYLSLAIIAIIAVNRKVNNFWAAASLYTIIMGLIVVYIIFSEQVIPWLANIFPQVFQKLVMGNETTLVDNSRFTSPFYNIQIWLQDFEHLKPIYGSGIQGANNAFVVKCGEAQLLSQTSTTTFYLAEFGLFGLVFTIFFNLGIFKIKNMQIEDKVLLAILFLLILNKEPHMGISFEWVFMFLTVKEFIDKDEKALAFDEVSPKALLTCFTNKDDSSVIKKNIVLSFAVRGLALALGFLSFPLYMSYFIEDEPYGVWLTVLNLMQIIITLDLGLGNGLKNKIVKALVDNDKERQKELISSAYSFSFLISIGFMLIIAPLILFCDMNQFLGVNPDVVSPEILKASCLCVCGAILLQFSLKNVSSLIQAKQKQALSGLFALISTVLLMGFALIMGGKLTSSNDKLLYISIFYIFSINLPLIVGSIIVFNTFFKGMAPSFRRVSKKGLKDVVGLGLGFFAIQLFLLALNSTNDILISNLFGADTTVIYNVYYKPFNIVASLFSIVTLPYWAMIAKEKEEANSSKIKGNLKQCLLFFAGFAFITVCLLILFKPFVNVWLAEKAPEDLAVGIAAVFFVFTIEWMALSAFTAIANGLSMIKEQIWLFATAAIIKAGLCALLYAGNNNLGWNLPWYSIPVINVIAFVPLVVGLILLVLFKIKKMKGGAKQDEQIN